MNSSNSSRIRILFGSIGVTLLISIFLIYFVNYIIPTNDILINTSRSLPPLNTSINSTSELVLPSISSGGSTQSTSLSKPSKNYLFSKKLSKHEERQSIILSSAYYLVVVSLSLVCLYIFRNEISNLTPKLTQHIISPPSLPPQRNLFVSTNITKAVLLLLTYVLIWILRSIQRNAFLIFLVFSFSFGAYLSWSHVKPVIKIISDGFYCLYLIVFSFLNFFFGPVTPYFGILLAGISFIYISNLFIAPIAKEIKTIIWTIAQVIGCEFSYMPDITKIQWF